MHRYIRRLQLLLGLIVFATLTMGCQVLFGDFKVGDHPREGEGGAENGSGGSAPGGNPSGGSAMPNGGESNPVMGPLVVVPTSDLFTNELGAQAKFYVSLRQKPTRDVNMPVVSQTETDGTVSPQRLTFTPMDWNAPQAVTVTGVDDPRMGNQTYSVKVGPAESDDPFFNGASASVQLTNIDNDSAGFFVTPTKDLVTTEAGGQAFFTVVLNTKPHADVAISLKSSDEKSGTVRPESLTFTPENWGSPQTVTLTGVDDKIVGNDRSYTITVGPLQSNDSAFAALPSQTVNVKTVDNDRAGVMVALATGIDPNDTTRLRTSEGGESATFTVVLNKAPQKDVTIGVASTSNEGKVSPTSLTFTAASWAAPQTVTVTGADNDKVADGNQPYQVKLGPITGDDPDYTKVNPADLPVVNVVNYDNDKANVTVTLLTNLDPNDPSQLFTTENGGVATLSVVLNSKPTDPVHFDVTSTNEYEGTVSPAGLDFSVDNWNDAQRITVSGVDDDVKDGNVVYAVRITPPMTDDPAYQKLPGSDVKVVNLDDDVAGLTPPKLLSGIDSGTKLITTEAGGTATFSISLTSKPKADVTVPVTSSNTNEGRVTPATLTFTAKNYATPQIITVTGQDDSVVDRDQPYTVTVGPTKSDDTYYVGLTQTVKVTNKDNDSAYIVPSTYSGTTTEAGGTATFGIRLNSQPTTNVTVTFTSSNANEGRVAPSNLLFTPSNWSTSQNITVTGVDDAIADGDVSFTIAVKGTNTTDPDYMYAATTLTVVNADNDKAEIKVTAAANLQTNEGGGKVTFTVALGSQPTANVSVSATSSATKEGAVAPASLTFTASNWSTPQTVTVTGVDDSVVDGNQSYTITLKASGADAKYAALAASTVSIVNVDDDKVGITVNPTTCATTPGTTATFSIVLKSQPLGPVSIALSSDTPTEGAVAPALVSFTAMNWNVAQQVTVTGADDGTMGMMTPYKIVTAAAVSAMDSAYNGLNGADVACVNTTPAPVEP